MAPPTSRQTEKALHVSAIVSSNDEADAATPQRIELTRFAGYCQLCRREEIERYGTCVGDDEELHTQSCLDAGCLHPAYYEEE